MVTTPVGEMEDSALDRNVIFENSGGMFTIAVEWRLKVDTALYGVGHMVRRDAFPLKNYADEDPMMTIYGMLPKSELNVTTGFEENENEFVVWVQATRGGELVRRDAQLVLKKASAVLGAIAGGVGDSPDASVPVGA